MAGKECNITTSFSTQLNPGNIVLTNYVQKSNEYYLPVTIPERLTIASLSSDVILWLIELRHRGESSDSSFEQIIVLTDDEDVSFSSEEDNREVHSDLSCNSELLDEYLQLENSKPEEYCQTNCLNFYQQVDVGDNNSEQSLLNLDLHRKKQFYTSKDYENEFDIWEGLKIPKVNFDSSSSLCSEVAEGLNLLSGPEMSEDKKNVKKVSPDGSCSSKQELAQTAAREGQPVTSSCHVMTNVDGVQRDKLLDLKCDDILNNLDEMIKKFEQIQEKAATVDANVDHTRSGNLSLKDNEFVEMCETADYIIEETLKCHVEAASKVVGGRDIPDMGGCDVKKPKIALKPNFLQESGFGSNSSDLSDDVFINSSEEKRDFIPHNINEIFDNGSNPDGQPPSAPLRKAKKKELGNAVQEIIQNCTKESGSGTDFKLVSTKEPSKNLTEDRTIESKDTAKEFTRDIFKTLPKELPKELVLPVALPRKLLLGPPLVAPRRQPTEPNVSVINKRLKEEHIEALQQCKEPNSSLPEKLPKELPKEMTPSLAPRQPKEATSNFNEKASKEVVPRPKKESIEDLSERVPKELPKEMTPSLAPRQPKEATSNFNEKASKEVVPRPKKESIEDLSERVPKELSKEMAPSLAPRQPKEATSNCIENVPKEIPKCAPPLVALEQSSVPDTNSVEKEQMKLPQNVPIVRPRKPISNMIEKESKGLSKEVVPKQKSDPFMNLPENVPTELSKEMAPSLAPRKPNGATYNYIENFPKEMLKCVAPALELKQPNVSTANFVEKEKNELAKEVASVVVPKPPKELPSEELPKELTKEVVPILVPRPPSKGLISNLPNMLNRDLSKDIAPKVFPRQLTKDLLQKKLPRELPREEVPELMPRQTSSVQILAQLPKESINPERPKLNSQEQSKKLLSDLPKEGGSNAMSQELPNEASKEVNLNVLPKQSSIFSKVTSKVLPKEVPKELSYAKEHPKIMHNELHKSLSKDMTKQLPRYQNDSFNLASSSEKKINNANIEDTCCLTSIKYDSEFVTPYRTPSNSQSLDLKIHLTPTRPISSTTFPPNLQEGNRKDTKPVCHHLSLRETSPKRPKSIVDQDNMARSQSSNDLVTKRSTSLKWLPKSPRSSITKLLEPNASTNNLPETRRSRSQALNEEKYDEILERLRKGSNASDITAWKQTLNTVTPYYHDDEMDPTAMQSYEWFSSNDLDKCGLSCEDIVDSDCVSLVSTSQTEMGPDQLQKLSVANITSLIEAELRGKQNGPYRITKARSMLSTSSKFFGDDKMEPAISLEQWCENMVVLGESMLCRTKITENGKKVRKNWVSSYVVLTKTHVLFFKDVKTFHAMKINPETFRPELSLNLAGGYIEKDEKISRRKNKFTLSTMDGCQVILQSPSSTLIEQWYSLMEGAISELPGHNTCPMIKKPKSKEQSPTSMGNNEEETFKLPRFVLNKDESMEDLTASAEERQTKTRARLKKFFNRRPTKESLVKKGIYKDEPMFGRDLCDIAVCYSAMSPCIPHFVIQCIHAIECKDENMKTDGLYRASGNLSQVQKIRLQVDQNSLSCLDEEEDVHVLTGVLKLFFRELKKPLIPFHLFNKAIDASSIRSHKERVKKLQDIINALPAPNHDTLEFLLQHLIRVTKNMEYNRMHIPNIAIVFGPTLMWPEEESLNMALDLMKQNQVVECLLTDYEEIFQ